MVKNVFKLLLLLCFISTHSNAMGIDDNNNKFQADSFVTESTGSVFLNKVGLSCICEKESSKKWFENFEANGNYYTMLLYENKEGLIERIEFSLTDAYYNQIVTLRLESDNLINLTIDLKKQTIDLTNLTILSEIDPHTGKEIGRNDYIKSLLLSGVTLIDSNNQKLQLLKQSLEKIRDYCIVYGIIEYTNDNNSMLTNYDSDEDDYAMDEE